MEQTEPKLVKCRICTNAFYIKADDDREYCPFCGEKHIDGFKEAKVTIN